MKAVLAAVGAVFAFIVAAPAALLAGSADSPQASTAPVVAGTVAGLNPVVTDAHRRAAQAMPAWCAMTPAVLAGFAEVESGNAVSRQVRSDGSISPPIIGLPLDGSGNGGNTVAITDTDHGRLDGDPIHDRAVGMMQFIPETWASSGLDGNGDGVADPQNVYDASLSAAVYLCRAAQGPITDPAVFARAAWSYNQSHHYRAEVEAAINRMRGSVTP